MTCTLRQSVSSALQLRAVISIKLLQLHQLTCSSYKLVAASWQLHQLAIAAAALEAVGC